jgi:hypothetical protein
MAQRPKQMRAQRVIDPLCSASEIALVVVLGAAGGIGKSTISDVFASFFEAAEISAQMVRVETGVRRDEFAPQDIVIDLDAAAEAAIGFGGEAAIFEPAWAVLEDAIAGRHVVVCDGGANAQRAILEMAGVTGLAGRVATANRETVVVVVTEPTSESGRQASALLRDAAERMPEARMLLAINYTSPTERFGADTPQARGFAAQMRLHPQLPQLMVPFAKAQALAAFGAGHMSMLQIMRASEAELAQLTGGGMVATASAHAHFGAWWAAVTRQLEQLFPIDAR